MAIKLATLAHHPKWEVRRAVANGGSNWAIRLLKQPCPDSLLDDNERVRQAAQQATLRRRDSRNARRIWQTARSAGERALDDVEARFGVMGREAVRRGRASRRYFRARAVPMKLIRLLSPLLPCLQNAFVSSSPNPSRREAMRDETTRIGATSRGIRAVPRARMHRPAGIGYFRANLCERSSSSCWVGPATSPRNRIRH